MDTNKDLTPIEPLTEESKEEDGSDSSSNQTSQDERLATLNQTETPNRNDLTPDGGGAANTNPMDNHIVVESGGHNESTIELDHTSLAQQEIKPAQIQSDVLELRSNFVNAIKKIDKIVGDGGTSQSGISATWITAERVRDVLSDTNDVLQRLLTQPTTSSDSFVDTPSRLNASNASTEYMSMPLTEAAWQEMAYISQGMEGNLSNLVSNVISMSAERARTAARPVQDFDLTGDNSNESEYAQSDSRTSQSKNERDRTIRAENIPSSSFPKPSLLNPQVPELVLDSSITKKGRRVKRPSEKSSKPTKLDDPEFHYHEQRHATSPDRIVRRRGDRGRSEMPDEDDAMYKPTNTIAGRRVNTSMIEHMGNRQAPTPEELELYRTVRRVRTLVEQEGHQAGINFIKKNFAKSPHYDALIEVVITTSTRYNITGQPGGSNTSTNPSYSVPHYNDPNRNIDPARRNFNIPKPKIDPTTLPGYLQGGLRPMEFQRLSNTTSGIGQSETSDFHPLNTVGGYGQSASTSSISGRSVIQHDDDNARHSKKEKKTSRSRDRRSEEISHEIGVRVDRSDGLNTSNSYDSIASGACASDADAWARQFRNERPEKLFEMSNSDDMVRRFQKYYEDSQLTRSGLRHNEAHNSAYNNGPHNPSLISLEQRLERLAIDIVMRDEERDARFNSLQQMIHALTTRLDIIEINTNRALVGQADINQRLSTLASDNDLYRRVNDLLRRCSTLETAGSQSRAHAYENVDNINLRSTGSAFRRPERVIATTQEEFRSGNFNVSRDPPRTVTLLDPSRVIGNDFPFGNPTTGGYPGSVASHFDTHHSSNLSTGIGLNNMNRDGFVFNPNQLAAAGYHSTNTSAAVFGTGSGQSVLNNLTLNNQIPQPRPRANNYWDNFRSYSRQNLLSSPKANGAASSCNVEVRLGAGSSSLLPEELNNQSATIHMQNNIRPDLVVNRNPVGNGSKTHIRSPQFVENIASSKKKNKDQSHLLRLNSGGTGTSVQNDPHVVEDRTELHTVQHPGTSFIQQPSMFRVYRAPEPKPSSVKVATSDVTDENKELVLEINKFLDDNLNRPTYVLELLQKLSTLGTDMARQRALSALQEVIHDQAPSGNIDLDSVPQSPVRGDRSVGHSSSMVQPPQLGVVVPFIFNRADEEENNEPTVVQQPSSSASTTATTVTMSSGLRMTRITAHYAGRGGGSSVPPPARVQDSNESIGSIYNNMNLDEIMAAHQSDSEDGEIHDLMDLMENPDGEDGELINDDRREDAVSCEASGEARPIREQDDDNVDGGDATGFVPIRF